MAHWFFTHRTHLTRFNSASSYVLGITSRLDQGSALDSPLFIINWSDHQCFTSCNAFVKYVCDVTLIVFNFMLVSSHWLYMLATSHWVTSLIVYACDVTLVVLYVCDVPLTEYACDVTLIVYLCDVTLIVYDCDVTLIVYACYVTLIVRACYITLIVGYRLVMSHLQLSLLLTSIPFDLSLSIISAGLRYRRYRRLHREALFKGRQILAK